MPESNALVSVLRPKVEEMPSFKNEIPEFLLKNNPSDEIRWLMENSSVIGQQVSWLAKEQHHQSVTLSKVVDLQLSTNGRIKRAEEILANHQELFEAHKRILEDHRELLDKHRNTLDANNKHIASCPLRTEKGEAIERLEKEVAAISDPLKNLRLFHRAISSKVGATIVGLAICAVFFFLSYIYDHVSVIPALISRFFQ